MAGVKASIGGGQAVGSLSFNEIIGFVPGQGRGDAKKGMYESVKNGDILVVYSVNPAIYDLPARKNRKKTNRTGKSRVGMAIVDKSTGALRLVTCDDQPDGEKKWRPFNGTISLSGNPHVVDPAPVPAGDFEEDDED